MAWLEALLAALGVVLVVSGAIKVADPAPAATVLAALSLRSGWLEVRLIGLYEMSVGVAVIVAGGVLPAALLALSYAGFALVNVALLRRSDGMLSCGCFGGRSGLVSPAHVVVDAGAALVAVGAAAVNLPGFFEVHPGSLAVGMARVTVVGLAAIIVVALLMWQPARSARLGNEQVDVRPFGPMGARVDGDPLNGVNRADVPAPAVAAPSTSLEVTDGTGPHLDPGAVAHDIEGTAPDGSGVVVGVAGTGHKTFIAFLGARCRTCTPFWQDAEAAGAALHATRATKLVLVTRGPEIVDPAVVRRVAPPDRTTVMSSSAWEDYGVRRYPYFVLVDGPSSRVISAGTVSSWDEVFALAGHEGASPLLGIDRMTDSLPTWLDPRLRVASSWIEGLGLFTVRTIRAGEVVITLSDQQASPGRVEELVARGELGRSLRVDEDPHLVRALRDQAAITNHSCDPNLWLRDGFSLVARYDIDAGEELAVDYATLIADPRWHMACGCKSPRCRGIITGNDWKQSDLRHRYADHFAPLIVHQISASTSFDVEVT